MPEFLKLKKSNCKNCYKCIRHCPVKSIKFSGDQAHIVSNECILCGQCFVVCPQNAKEIANDVEKVKVMLAGDEPVVVSLAPSFIANYDDIGIEEMEKALKKLGFHSVEETECSLKEIEMITNFYHQILIQQDPLALLYKINQKIYKNKTTNQEKNKNIDNSSKITMLITIVLIIIFVLFIAGILNCI